MFRNIFTSRIHIRAPKESAKYNLLPSAPEGTPASSSLLMDLPAGIHGKRAVELTGIRPLLKPLHGCVKKGHVLVFPDQIMRRAGDVNKDLLGYRH